MRSARGVLLRTLAIAAFTCLWIGGSARLCSAGGDMDTGYQSDTDTIQNGTGSGTGGSTDTGTGGSWGAGTGGSTDTSTGSDNSDSNMKNDEPARGSTEGGVFYPDNSNVLGPSGRDYQDK